MSSQTPPNPYFNNINFNPNFFKTTADYITRAFANSTFLKLIGGFISGKLGIGVSSYYSANTRLTISGASSGYSEPLVRINQENAWNGNYALEVIGYTNLNGFRINGSDSGNSIYNNNVNLDMGISQYPGNTTGGNISLTTFGAGGNILFYTNGANERLRITPEGRIGIGTNNPSDSLLYINGKTTINNASIQIYSSSSVNNPVDIYSAGTTANNCVRIANNSGVYLFMGIGGSAFGGNYQNNAFIEAASGGSLILNVNAASGNTPRMIIKHSLGYVGIATTNPINILQVGSGGRLRIANDNTDYTLIGTDDIDNINNSRIVISGISRGSYNGRIEFFVTAATGFFSFYKNNSEVFNIDSDDVGVYNSSMTTYNNNYYTDGKYLNYASRTNSAGVVQNGYFYDLAGLYNSFVNVAISHNGSTYTYWHGQFGTNNTGGIIYFNLINGSSMTVQAFYDLGTLKPWLYMVPSVSFNSATQMRVKFYG